MYQLLHEDLARARQRELHEQARQSRAATQWSAWPAPSGGLGGPGGPGARPPQVGRSERLSSASAGAPTTGGRFATTSRRRGPAFVVPGGG